MDDRLAAVDMRRKERGEGVAVPLSRGAGCPSNTMSPGPRSTSLPSGILIHAAVWPQRIWTENWGGELCNLEEGTGWVPI